SRPATPVRVRSLHSMMIAASKSPSTRSAISMSETPGKAISGAGAGSAFTTRTSWPSARSANAIASCEPIESPSGLAWEEMTKRRRVRIASTICSAETSLLVGLGLVGIDLVQQLLDAVLAGNGIVVDERDLGDPLAAEPRSDLPAQERDRPPERARRVLPAGLVGE